MSGSQEETQHNVRVVPFEKQHGYGVDLVIIRQNPSSGNLETWLVEIKSCKLSISDVDNAIRQFRMTEQTLRRSHGQTINIIRILLHDNVGSCSTFDKAIKLLRRENIQYLPVSQGGKLARRLLNLYKSLYR